MSQRTYTQSHQGQQGKFDFDGNMIVGNIHSWTALRLLREWASLHRTKLETNWQKMKAGRPLERSEPGRVLGPPLRPSVLTVEFREVRPG